MAAYCATSDLLTGSIPTPSYLDPDKFVQDAADEIDSHLGFVYGTPFDVSDNPGNELVRPARLLLKRLNVWLASGRLLLAAASSGEDDNLHAYAKSLVDGALATLEKINTGEILLEGAKTLVDQTVAPRGPMWSNPDLESAVDAFYSQLVPVNVNGSRINGALASIAGAESWPRRSGG